MISRDKNAGTPSKLDAGRWASCNPGLPGKFERHFYPSFGPSHALECDDVIKRAHISKSRGLPHREVTGGLRRPPFLMRATQSIGVLEQILGC